MIVCVAPPITKKGYSQIKNGAYKKGKANNAVVKVFFAITKALFAIVDALSSILIKALYAIWVFFYSIIRSLFLCANTSTNRKNQSAGVRFTRSRTKKERLMKQRMIIIHLINYLGGINILIIGIFNRDRPLTL